MPKPSDVFTGSATDTVIAAGVRLKGNVSSEGDIAVDGLLAGNIKSGGHVTIGPNGRIGGAIQGVSVTVAGQVEGNVKATDSVSIAESGQIHGDIDCGRLEITLGGVFIGTSKMKPVAATEIDDRTEVEG